jgi:hypothetical protein
MKIGTKEREGRSRRPKIVPFFIWAHLHWCNLIIVEHFN